jgi:hypothetical protein
VVSAQGAPEIDWNLFVTEVNNTDTYTFSVRSTGSSAPTSLIWEKTENGTTTQSLAGVTGNTVSLTFSGTGSITLKVTPVNSCGTGTAITKVVSMTNQNLVSPTVTPGSGTFCGGVSFKIEQPTSWTPEQWAVFSAGNITAATLGGAAYPGTLTTDGTAFYYYIAASSVTAQTASLTVGGQIGAKLVDPVTVTAQVQTSTASTFAGTGTTCFDINYSNVSGRTKADFTQNYTYSLSGTLGSGASISNVTWTYRNAKNAVQVFIPGATNGTVTGNQVVVKYNPALLSDATIGTAGILVVITATVTTTGGACPNAVYTVEIPVIIKDEACCEGAIIANGAYNNVAAQTGLSGDWSASWTGGFTAKNQDLCWNKSNVGQRNWANAVAACTGQWRLPNLRELYELYKAMGRSTNFGNLQSPNSNPGAANNMTSFYYWSRTEGNGSNAYTFYFNTGRRGYYGKNLSDPYVRCVRDL